MKESLKNILGGVAVVLGLVLLAYFGLQVKNLYSSPQDISKLRTVTMSAEGKVTGKPDTATLSFSVVTQGVKAEDVQKENDSKMAKVTDFLKSKGVKDDDIQTSGYNLYPQYNYQSGQQPAPITGYSQNQQVSAKIRNLDILKSVTSGLTGQGVNQIDNLTFYIDDPDKLKAEAREKATEKAKVKAEELAKNLGVNLGRVVNFSEGISDGGLYPQYARSEMGGGGGSPIQPGTQDVTVNVNLTFELK